MMRVLSRCERSEETKPKSHRTTTSEGESVRKENHGGEVRLSLTLSIRGERDSSRSFGIKSSQRFFNFAEPVWFLQNFARLWSVCRSHNSVIFH